MSGTAKEVLQIGRQLAELEEALTMPAIWLSDYRFTIFQINLMGKQDALDSMEEKHAEAMRHFNRRPVRAVLCVAVSAGCG